MTDKRKDGPSVEDYFCLCGGFCLCCAMASAKEIDTPKDDSPCTADSATTCD